MALGSAAWLLPLSRCRLGQRLHVVEERGVEEPGDALGRGRGDARQLGEPALAGQLRAQLVVDEVVVLGAMRAVDDGQGDGQPIGRQFLRCRRRVGQERALLHGHRHVEPGHLDGYGIDAERRKPELHGRARDLEGLGRARLHGGEQHGGAARDVPWQSGRVLVGLVGGQGGAIGQLLRRVQQPDAQPGHRLAHVVTDRARDLDRRGQARWRVRRDGRDRDRHRLPARLRGGRARRLHGSRTRRRRDRRREQRGGENGEERGLTDHASARAGVRRTPAMLRAQCRIATA